MHGLKSESPILENLSVNPSQVSWSFSAPYIRCYFRGVEGIGELPVLPGRPDMTIGWRQAVSYETKRWPVGAWMAYRELCAALGEFEWPQANPAIQGFLWGSLDQILDQLEAKKRAGMRFFKLKVGQDPEWDAKRVNAVVAELPDHPSLRLDANQKWSLDQALHFADLLEAPHRIEYLEEPLSDPELLSYFHEETGLSLALDEHLWEAVMGQNAPFLGWTTCVIKPHLLRVGELMTILNFADRYRLQTVFSSALETSVGLRHILKLAAEFSPDVAVGVDTEGVY